MAAESRAVSRVERRVAAPVDRVLLACLFHLNLAFSSLEEASQADVVRRCYWPALELIDKTGFPIAIEATGWTLRRIGELDPAWIERARALLAGGWLELVGSAHAQCAAPLLPAEVNSWNLRLGREAYAELLGVAPRIALVCEQVYSPGLVPLYLQAGYEAVVVDWDNAYRSHPDWPAAHRRYPQRAVGGGRSIPVVWSESIAFQKFQRFAHGELPLGGYVDYVRAAVAEAGNDGECGGGAFMLYANDVEIFDHRPGRFAAEPVLEDGEREWERIAEALRALREEGVGVPALPSGTLDLLGAAGAGHELSLEAPSQPIPVKKQDKYNITRWAVTGRDDIGINTRCWRLYRAASRPRVRGFGPLAWSCASLWASDFRTHITESRWEGLLGRLERSERRWLPVPVESPSAGERILPLTVSTAHEASVERSVSAVTSSRDSLELWAGPVALRLNLRRGMAIEAFADARVCDQPLLGTLEHGYFPTIELGADFYSGHLVQESPLTHKVTDLERVTPEVGVDRMGRLCARASIVSGLGPIGKAVRLDPAGGAVEIEWVLHWSELPLGSLRLGHVTLLPAAFDPQTLWYGTHNGGTELEVHRIPGPAFDHGAAVSGLVSCRQGLGATEGLVLLGDAERTIRVELDQARARALALMSWTPGPERWLLRLSFALTESDETRRGGIPRASEVPQGMRMRILAERTADAMRRPHERRDGTWPAGAAAPP